MSMSMHTVCITISITSITGILIPVDFHDLQSCNSPLVSLIPAILHAYHIDLWWCGPWILKNASLNDLRCQKESPVFRTNVCWIDLILCIMMTPNVSEHSENTRSWRINQQSPKCIFERSEVPKKRFLAIFWTGANLRNLCWIDLILHTVIVLNVFQHEVILLHVTRGWGYTSSCYKGVEGRLVWCAVWYSKVKVAAFIFYGG